MQNYVMLCNELLIISIACPLHPGYNGKHFLCKKPEITEYFLNFYIRQYIMDVKFCFQYVKTW
jgi:hypothetical protein